MKSNPNLKRAIPKLRRFYKDIWVGYLTPCEIIAIVADGARPECKQKFEWAQEQIKKGESTPTWFYFKLGKLKL